MISADQIEAFDRDGVVYLPGAFAGWVDALRAGVERNIADPGPTFRAYAMGRDGSPALVACRHRPDARARGGRLGAEGRLQRRPHPASRPYRQ